MFCEKWGQLSEEDIIPLWLGKLLPGHGEKLDMTVHDSHGNVTRRYGSNHFKVTKHAPCLKCNNGWMSVLENEKARPILTPMVRGDRAFLNEDAQRIIAFWALKTMAMYSLIGDERVVPLPEFRALYKDQAPPAENTWVRLAAYVGQYQLGQVHFQPLIAESTSRRVTAPNGYTATLTVNHLVVQVFRFLDTERFSFTNRAFQGAALTIWPYARPRRWPPLYRLTDSTLNRFERALFPLTEPE